MKRFLTDRECELLSVKRWESNCEWAENTIVIAKGPTKGRLRLSVTPYLRHPIDLLGVRHVRMITLMMGSQQGKTLFEMIGVARVIDLDPGDGVMMLPRKEDAEEIGKDRLRAMFEVSPRLRQYAPTDRDLDRAFTAKHIKMNGATIFLSTSGSTKDVASKTLRFGWEDEQHLWRDIVDPDEGDTDALLAARFTNHPFDSQRIKGSTPTTTDAAICETYDLGTRDKWHEPCPFCGHLIYPMFSMIKWPDEITVNELQTLGGAWLECPSCLAKITDDAKPEMLQNGRWVSPCEIENPSHWSGRVSGISSPWRTFSGIAAGFMECMVSSNRQAKIRTFINTVCGEEYEEVRSTISTQVVEQIVQKQSDDSVLLRGMVPRETLLLTIGVDWHGEKLGYFWSAWAFTVKDDRRHFWLVDYGQERSRQDLLREIWDAPWVGPDNTVIEPSRKWLNEDGVRYRPFILVDSGWGKEMGEVYDFVAPRYPQMMAAKGEGDKGGYEKIVRTFSTDVSAEEQGRRKYGMNALMIQVTPVKDSLVSMIRQANEFIVKNGTDEDGSPLPESRIHFCRNVDKAFLKSLSSQRKVQSKTNRKTWVWELKPNHGNDHWLDTTALAFGAAEFRSLTQRVFQATARPKQARQEQKRMSISLGMGTAGNYRRR